MEEPSIQSPLPGEHAVNKSDGTTPTEQHLAYLSNRTFLSLWSYPNLWRDQRSNGDKQGDGKELCDLLVVFEDHVIIFSDKAIEYPTHADPVVAWGRWYRRAIAESAKQIFGAERWIRQYPERVFLDPKCTKRFPVPFPPQEKVRFHRVIVARGAGAACRVHFGEGTGSLMIVPRIIGEQHYGLPKGRNQENAGPAVEPFRVGQVDPKNGYVHVLDDATLDTLMRTLDTVGDFVDYLGAKERFVQSGKLAVAAGEEELLAHYLKNLSEDEKQHEFTLPSGTDFASFDLGLWESFQRHPQRLAQIAANRSSYIWDRLIERFSFHVLNDSQHFASKKGVEHIEPALRFLARESRTRRRMLAQSVLGLVERTRVRKRILEVRAVEPSDEGDPYYIFLVLRRFENQSYKEYREGRRAVLVGYLQSLKVVYPEAVDLVGIAFGPEGEGGDTSEDLLYINTREWTDEDLEEAKRVQRETGFLSKINKFRGTTQEYPDVEKPISVQDFKGRDRNKPCPCGSGLKYKRCHGK